MSRFPHAGGGGPIDRKLDKLFFEVEDIVGLSKSWNEETDALQYSERLAWLSCLGDLEDHLDPAYRAGQMTSDQKLRYRELLLKLVELLPILDKLDFSRPTVSLDSAA